MRLLKILIRNLLLTTAIEGAAMAALLRRRDAVEYSALVNVMTNPLLNVLVVVLSGTAGLPYWPVTAVLEVCAVAAEGVAYSALMPELGRARCGLLSLGLNGLSFGLGLAIG